MFSKNMVDHSAIEKLKNPYVLATTRSAMVLAYELAQALAAPLDLYDGSLSEVAGRSVILVEEAAAPNQRLPTLERLLRDRGARTIERVRATKVREPSDEEIDMMIESTRRFAVPFRDNSPEQVGPRSLGMVVEDGHGVRLSAELTLPNGCLGLVVFAHGRGSGKDSRRNRHVAATLQGARLATVLFDFQTDEFSEQAARLESVIRWAFEKFPALPIGCFGAGTGSVAALLVASRLQTEVQGVVCRSGPVGEAEHALGLVRAPALLIVGEEDREMAFANRRALRSLVAEAKLELIPGATHLFAEPGALEAVAHLSADWFLDCFRHSSALVLKSVQL